MIAKFTKRLAALLFSVLIAVSVLFVAADSAAAARVTVNMGASTGAPLAFEPKTVTINAGDSIKWVMNKLGPHNVIFDKVPAGVNASAISHSALESKAGSSFTVTFDTPGTYSYYCTPHRGAGMVGTVTIL